MLTNTLPKIKLLTAVRELSADLETPVSVYLKLAGEAPSFLLESVTGGQHLARYSFIGVNPSQAYILRGDTLEEHSDDEVTITPLDGREPLEMLRQVLHQFLPVEIPGLPRFTGGLVGYLSYDIIRHFEPTVPTRPHANFPEAIFLLADNIVAFDHAYGKIILIANIAVNGSEEATRAEAEERMDTIQAKIEAELPTRSPSIPGVQNGELHSNMTQDQFELSVLRAKEHITAGNIFQVVLSQRLERKTNAAPFDIYRALRRLNPSPYMYFFDFNGLAGGADFQLIGASPELHVRLEGQRAALRPIAGTRPRGVTTEEDTQLEKDLLADPKELAEHTMLVDLARNDLGRVCQYGSVQVSEKMVIERYSHVMHIVSHVEGELQPQHDAFDLMKATFPAGTVSGAPKIRAMQIIAELEPDARGPYAGAVGYFSYDGSMDTCITIRTLVMHGDTISVQAGAGIVADSDPKREYQETMNKARALAVAIEMAEGKHLNR
jgi:anthranilate synthase component 1